MKITTLERDKFLTEAMSECWHENIRDMNGITHILKCTCGRIYSSGRKEYIDSEVNHELRKEYACRNNDFSTWGGFGKLWEWTSKQEWWDSFYPYSLCSQSVTVSTLCYSGQDEIFHIFDQKFIDPDKFANAVYEYLKEKIK